MVVDATNLIFVKQLAGLEDLQFGFGTVVQVREGESVEITLINASNIPFSSTTSIADEINAIKAQLGI